ncbi:MAG: hypothetical protein QE285_12460 [Aquabacterium sp.]|nr:hypothetical protein [Aquabacterium sp.]
MAAASWSRSTSLLKNPAVVQALFGRHLPPLLLVCDRLANAVGGHIGLRHLMALLQDR